MIDLDFITHVRTGATMINRRNFILTGTLAGLPLAAGGVGAFGAMNAQASEPPASIYTVVYDDRFADSLAFARQSRRMGLRTSGISGDVTKLWYDDLYHRWKQGPVAIAGLTTVDALFCLETFGNDVGLRQVLKVEHRIQPGGGDVEHRLEGPAQLLQRASLEESGSAWAGRMAQLAASCPATRQGRIETTAISNCSYLRPAESPVLVSWVLAPTRRV